MRIWFSPKKIQGHKSDQGSIILIVTFGLVALLGISAIVTDFGMMYIEKSRLQNAVDAAALAGAQELPDNTNNSAITYAKDYALNNDQLNDADVTYQIADNNFKLTVSAKKTVSAYFARIWGVNSAQIAAKATALVVPPPALKNAAVPLCIKSQDLTYGTLYTLKTGPASPTTSNTGQYLGWFGALDLGSGAYDFNRFIINNYPGTLSTTQPVRVQTGNLSGPSYNAIQTRIASDTRIPPNTIDNYDRDAPEIIYLPVVNIPDNSNGSNITVTINSFAAFFVTGVVGQGTSSNINGYFIRGLVPEGNTPATLTELLQQEQAMESGSSTKDYGLYTVKLVNN